MRLLHRVVLSICAAGLIAGSNSSASAETAVESHELHILNAKDVGFWKVDGPLAPPAYPKDLLRAGVSGCVSIGFIIEPDGTTSGHRILKSKISGSGMSLRNKKAALASFASSALASLLKVRFVSGPDNPSKVRGFSQIPYAYSADQKALGDNCDIPDLSAFLQSYGQVP